MKRGCLFIIVLLCVYLAQALQRPPVINNAPGRSPGFTHHLPVDETEMLPASFVITTTDIRIKKCPCITPSAGLKALRDIVYRTTEEPVASNDFSTNYLLHIYPSLHFW